MSDLISRQVAIDALNEQIEECNKALSSFDISLMDKHEIEVERASLEAYKEQLENLPSAQPKRTNERTETHGVCLDAISRQAIKDLVEQREGWMTDYDLGLCTEDILRILDELPSA